MTMTEWFLAELESEAAKSRRVLEQAPAGQRAWKPHEKSMEFGYLSDLVANIPSWIGMAITMDELDIAPKDGQSQRRVRRCNRPPTHTSPRPGVCWRAATSPSSSLATR